MMMSMMKLKTPTNAKIFPSGATLVEEEDFNELTAVPSTTIVIASDVLKGNNSSSKRPTKHLPPLKLKQQQQINSTTISTPLQGSSFTAATTLKNALQRQSATASPTAAGLLQQHKQHKTNINQEPEEDQQQQSNERTPLFAAQKTSPQSDLASANNPAVNSSSNTTSNRSSPNNSINTTFQPNNHAASITTTTTTAASTATTAAERAATATTITYTHNSKTTRSWPVIYRNPHHYDYEALYAQGSRFAAQPAPAPAPTSATFRQNCYSNQFKQSIVYSSSNEDLTTINECAANGLAESSPPANGLAATTSGGSSSSSIFGGCGNQRIAQFQKQQHQQHHLPQQQQQQTTCYYFAPSRHNSIYEHPSAVVANSLQFDPHSSAATTAAAAAAVESIRRSNSILLRNSSCSSKLMHQASIGGSSSLNNHNNVGTPTSLNSVMDGTSNTGASSCCSSCCMGPPPVLFLFVTLLMTTSATAMLCAAIMTDHWEHVTWDRVSLERYSNRSNLHLEWIMEDKIAMLKPDKRDHRFRRDTLFLVPMHGGIWTLCIDLPIHELQELRRHPKFPRSAPTCLNYLAGSMENARGEEQRNDWQHRMQNLSISCSLVCLIILGSAALVGAFGVCQRQISAILITGVMYLLAALFALFTLMIIHFKRQQGRPMLDSDYDGTVDGIVARPGGPAIMAKPLLGARIFLTSWSLDLGWGGVALCACTSVLWILLSKIMRYNPFSTLMI